MKCSFSPHERRNVHHKRSSRQKRSVRLGLFGAMLGVLPISCAQAQPEIATQEPTSPQPTRLAQKTGSSNVAAPVQWKIETVAQGAVHPWGMAWLPNGEILVTSREGTLHRVNGKVFDAIAMEGMPDIFIGGQGGLFDISLHPKFAQNKWIYFTLSTGTNNANRTTLVRGTYDGKKLSGITKLFQVNIDKAGGAHFGSRLQWLPDGTLLMSIGDGGNPPTRIGDRLAREQAQNVRSHQGSIVRLDENGKAARGNPIVRQNPQALPELWSIGHRNIQGLTRDARGRLWATEHGPRGGDELNLLRAGGNYGWPVVSHGRDYVTGEPVGVLHQEGMIDPVVTWTPSPGASGLAYYTGNRIPQWKGNLFSGSLATRDVRRVVLDANNRVVKQETLDIGRRVRDVKQGPDGFIYLLTDEQDGELLRLAPE